MKKTEMMRDIKKRFKKDTGIDLDFRKMVYLPNKRGNAPVYEQATGLKLAIFLNEYVNAYVTNHKKQYPDFDGFKFVMNAELGKLKSTKLRLYIEAYIAELFQRKASRRGNRPILGLDDKLHRRSVDLKNSDTKQAYEIGKGNISEGIRLALRAYKL